MGLLDILKGTGVVAACASPVFRKTYKDSLIGSSKKYFCSQCKKMLQHKYVSEEELKCSECGNISIED